MWPLTKNVLLQTFLLCFLVVYGDYLGDDCYNNESRANGLCIAVSDCPQAIANLKQRIRPQDCGFNGNVSLVCCPSDTSRQKPITQPTITAATTTPTTTATTTAAPKPINNRIAGEESRQKCKYYEDYGYKYERQPTLLPGQTLLRVSVCPWRSDVNPVIVEGEPADLGEFPHMALLGYKSGNTTEWKCGGSLISENFVITAAHCLYSRKSGAPTLVRIGDLNYTNPNDDTYAKEIQIEEIYQHPEYKTPESYNDVALLKLARPAQLSAHVKPICLYASRDTTTIDKVIVTGWGNTEYAGQKSDHLLKATLNVFTTVQCNKTYTGNRGILPRGIDENLQLCAGPLVGRKDTCQGDSGGPIQIRSLDHHCSYVLLGVTSFGKRCGVESIPAVYATIYPHLKWIEDIVWP